MQTSIFDGFVESWMSARKRVNPGHGVLLYRDRGRQRMAEEAEEYDKTVEHVDTRDMGCIGTVALK